MRCATTAPLAVSTNPLSARLATAIRDRWFHSGDFRDLADALIDEVSDHIRERGVRALDPRLGDAIADAIRDHSERDHAPNDAPGQQLLDLEPSCGDRVIARVGADGRVDQVEHWTAERHVAAQRIGGAR